jgi:hypothetical protein
MTKASRFPKGPDLHPGRGAAREVTRAMREEIVEASREASSMKGNPVDLSAADLTQVIENAV